MIVCDLCKRIPKGTKNIPFDLGISITKAEETNTGKKKLAAEREILNIRLTLCDPCISVFNQKLGHLCQSIRNAPSPGELDEAAQANAEKIMNREPTDEFEAGT